MLVETKKLVQNYQRKSKSGLLHNYYRTKTIVILVCDNCQRHFERPLGNMDSKRLNNDYFHVCSHCNQKSFAQRVGQHNRKFWNLSADSDQDINSI